MKISYVLSAFPKMLLALLVTLNLAFAQAPKPTAIESMKYRFESTEGTNASAVAFIPGPKVFITVIAGNASFPMEVFDMSGSTIHIREAGLDLRGIWYNPKSNTLEANAYGESGWFSRELNSEGLPIGDWKCIKEGMHQPEEQSVLSYDPTVRKLITIQDETFFLFSRKNGKGKPAHQHGTPGDTDWYINPYVAAYTGNDAYPIAVLELNGDQILYFDLNGKYQGATQIEGGLPEIDGFRFSFAGNMAWIYDESVRTWTAYRVF
ncbi:MAG: hypothetical protein RLZZ165_2470 [Bacteroidota bacterium]|jgi:hypothetical protein